MANEHGDTTKPARFPTMGYLVWHLSLRWQAQLSDELEPLGVTPAEYAVLAHLRAPSASNVSPSQRELAEVSGLEPMYVSKLARALEQAKLVERTPNPHDARAVQVVLTRRGIDVADNGRRIAARLDRQRLAPFGGPSSEQAAQLKVSLELLLRDAERAHRHGPTVPAPAPRTETGS